MNPDEDWLHNGGDLPAAARAAAAAGSYLHVQVEPLGTFMAGDLASEVRAAWDALIAAVPDGAVAAREGWFSISAVMAGDRRDAIAVSRQIARELARDPAPRQPPYRIAITIVEIAPAEPESALEVDVSQEFQDIEGDAIGWVAAGTDAVAWVRVK